MIELTKILCFFCGILSTLAIGMLIVWNTTVTEEASGTLAASTVSFVAIAGLCMAVILNAIWAQQKR